MGGDRRGEVPLDGPVRGVAQRPVSAAGRVVPARPDLAAHGGEGHAPLREAGHEGGLGAVGGDVARVRRTAQGQGGGAAPRRVRSPGRIGGGQTQSEVRRGGREETEDGGGGVEDDADVHHDEAVEVGARVGGRRRGGGDRGAARVHGDHRAEAEVPRVLVAGLLYARGHQPRPAGRRGGRVRRAAGGPTERVVRRWTAKRKTGELAPRHHAAVVVEGVRLEESPLRREVHVLGGRHVRARRDLLDRGGDDRGGILVALGGGGSVPHRHPVQEELEVADAAREARTGDHRVVRNDDGEATTRFRRVPR